MKDLSNWGRTGGGEEMEQACPSFVSQGFGPEGDYEHSLYCRVCGWELAEHPECLTFDECEARGLDGLMSGQGPDCQLAHGERGLPHTQDCYPTSRAEAGSEAWRERYGFGPRIG